jgi:hypothetical protein
MRACLTCTRTAEVRTMLVGTVTVQVSPVRWAVPTVTYLPRKPNTHKFQRHPPKKHSPSDTKTCKFASLPPTPLSSPPPPSPHKQDLRATMDHRAQPAGGARLLHTGYTHSGHQQPPRARLLLTHRPSPAPNTQDTPSPQPPAPPTQATPSPSDMSAPHT